MKISEIIAQLQELKEEHGDMNVLTWKDGKYYEIHAITPDYARVENSHVAIGYMISMASKPLMEF